jgi:hypothetical protein
MNYFEYFIIGLLVAVAGGYALWKSWRVLTGKDSCGCAFRGGEGGDCNSCQLSDQCQKATEQSKDSQSQESPKKEQNTQD